MNTGACDWLNQLESYDPPRPQILAPQSPPVARRPMTPIDIIDAEEVARAVAGMSF